jgi:hypothetical protein
LEVGILSQLIGAKRSIDRTWCCDSCKQAAMGKHKTHEGAVQAVRLGHGSRLAESPQKT